MRLGLIVHLAFRVVRLWPRTPFTGYYADLSVALDRVSKFYEGAATFVVEPVRFASCRAPPTDFFRQYQRYDGEPLLVIVPPCPSYDLQGSTYGRSIWLQRIPSSTDQWSLAIAHEVGHALGLPHAYGNPHSIMGAYHGPWANASLTIVERATIGDVMGPPVGGSLTERARFVSGKDLWSVDLRDCALQMYKGETLVVDTSKDFNQTVGGYFFRACRLWRAAVTKP